MILSREMSRETLARQFRLPWTLGPCHSLNGVSTYLDPIFVEYHPYYPN